MDIAIKIAFLAITYVLSLGLSLGLIMDTIPKNLLRVRYSVSGKLGRGLKKMVYPEGRAVVYEPHPSVRKYINKYLLFTMDGYKYLQSKIGEGVKTYTASIVVFDSKNRVIDNFEITEVVSSSQSHPVRLHHKTSHIAYILTSVNGAQLPETEYMVVNASTAPFYFLSVTALVMLQFVHAIYTINEIASLIGKETVLSISYSFFILPSIAIGAACLVTALLGRIKNGVKVVLK